MNAVSHQLTDDRKHLLDLGLRNTLLNYRELKSKGVRVIDELPEQIFRLLVDDGKKMSFLPLPGEATKNGREDGNEDEEPHLDETLALIFEDAARGDEEDRVAGRHVDTKLQTPHTSARLQRRLLATYYAARTAMEERGINILFLALGMLEWYEDETSDILRSAPLVLIPVGLSRESVRSQFILRYTGDEIDTNLSLQMKLKVDFGATLPAIDQEGENDFSILEYFDSVAKSISNFPRWKVAPDAIALSFFSFQKLLMYKDLDEASWPPDRQPSSHSVLSQLLYDGFRETVPALLDGVSLDKQIDPAELHHVRDADSSQTAALLEARAGTNLVIQGPPGTGKSQTITNLVAEVIAQGKTMLFVSEKMAALEVVKRRLDEIGLGVACLELHSYKSNKKNVLTELERTLSLGKPSLGERDRSVGDVRQALATLNPYLDALHTPIGDSTTTPFEAFGVLLNLREHLRDVEDVPAFEDEGLANLSDGEYHERRELARSLEEHLLRLGDLPVRHPYWGSTRALFLPSHERSLVQEIRSTLPHLEGLRSAGSALTDRLEVQPSSTLSALDRWIVAARHASEAPDLTAVSLSRPEWLRERKALESAISAGRRVWEIRQRFDSLLLPEAWREDLLEARKDLAVYARKWWRGLVKRYWTAKRTIAGLYRSDSPSSPSDLLETVDSVLEAARLEEELAKSVALLADLFGLQEPGWRQDWGALETIASYMATTHEKIAARELPKELLSQLGQPFDHQALIRAAEEAERAVNDFRQSLRRVFDVLDFDPSLRFGKRDELTVPLDVLGSLLVTWSNAGTRLREIARWNELTQQLKELGMSSLTEAAAHWESAGEHLTQALDRARCRALVDRAMSERPEIGRFDGAYQNRQVGKFRKADRRLLELNRAHVAHQHWQGLPPIVRTGQMRVLSREFQKKRRHRPIRKLMADAGQAIQKIKPVFMMSPLSVATYLPPGVLNFDLVVFDEASQVRPVEAYGAILRANQAVVVGDQRQLPPTHFFGREGLVEDEEQGRDDEREVTESNADLESVLGAFCAQAAPQAMLRWHYRSRHESLIAVSNHEFYEDKLVVFPAPDDTRQEKGLVFHHLPDTAYEPGRGRARNREEAAIVARAVMRHARERPNRTLGVAAFSLGQMQVIQDELEILRSKSVETEQFFAAHPEEPFFVKNLENVQGDERDVIFISVGYGRNRQGFLSMNFGPLNRDGGERRLNVLITRSRLRCEVFSNLRAEDIDLERTRARGVVAFKTFLRYAEQGILDEARLEQGEAESPFEEAVARAVRQLGFEVKHQVGSSGFCIDLAVVDPESPGRYLLGIECDGARYHRSRWARDRDRLRQDVLESLGWQIHRIWSTDWFRQREREVERLNVSIENARRKMPTRPSLPPQEQAQGIVRDPPPPARERLRVSLYQTARLSLGRGQQAELHKVAQYRLREWIEVVVQRESPVHTQEVASRIAGAFGVKRVGRRIRQAMDAAVAQAVIDGQVRQRGDFLWWSEMGSVPVRDRSELSHRSRKVELIPPEELAEAVLRVVNSSVGIAPEEAVTEACRLLGYGRVSEQLKKAAWQAKERLLREGNIQEQNGYLMAPPLSNP